MTDTTGIDSDRFVVEQAKGAVMLRYGVGSYEALAAMARWAREAHVTIEDVAHALVKGICQGRVTPETQGIVRWLEQRLRTDIAGTSPSAPATAAAASAPTAPTAPTMTVRLSTTAGHSPPPRESATAANAAAARQWRYTSAVHAARSLGGS